MAKATTTTLKAVPNPADLTVLAVDVGGSHVKIRTNREEEKRVAASGPDMTAAGMVAAVRGLAQGLAFNVVSIGYPGPVLHNRPLAEPANLGKGWVGFDYAKAFGAPVKIVNDALMQAVGSYRDGRMLFLGLGTGLGAAMIADGVALPMELAHLPYKKGRSYEDYVGVAGLERRGKKKWRESVFDVVERLKAALEPDYVVIGGGNVELLEDLPPGSERGGNEFAFAGGFRLWQDEKLRF
ncbi:ROK family protein [Labrys wisconsinensis]|uniref:Polyphosphate glucokinase n=1 Tax=Labrys wisconsinensis TaxID=425677 RepID=A0ABU0JLC1_9HYPH|nr:ROK family protein [Labrys wisconsinensis]MDQ0474271.1 polyphosphate glucokinase [Labrys wisconsinensis]